MVEQGRNNVLLKNLSTRSPMETEIHGRKQVKLHDHSDTFILSLCELNNKASIPFPASIHTIVHL